MEAALQLLLMAEQLTVGKLGFRMYLTDWSLYNVAVDAEERLKIVDGENIIVVDLKKIEKGDVLSIQYPRKVHEKIFYFLLKWC